MTDIEPPMTIAELCIATGKSRATVYRMIQRGDIPTAPGGIVTRPLFRRWLNGDWTPPSKRNEPIALIHSRKAS